MGVAKKGRGEDFQNCSTSSKVLYGCQLVISGEKSFLARSATICKINTVWLPTNYRKMGNFAIPCNDATFGTFTGHFSISPLVYMPNKAIFDN